MKKAKLLFTLLCLLLGLQPMAAQSVKITKELTHVQMASVLAMYKNEFGSFEKPDMSDTFPFAVIRMHLEGNAHAVTAAKERLTLYLGQMFGVESRVTTYSNQILFLVRARRPYIYIDCGDGCEPKLLSAGQQLRSNCVYDCTVRYIPAGETPSNIDAELLSNIETRLDSLQLAQKQKLDSLQLAQEQKIESLQQAQLEAQEKPMIIRHSIYDQKLFGIEEYSYGETQMDKKALQQFLLENSPAAYKKYTQSQKLIKGGWATFSVGTTVALSSLIAVGIGLRPYPNEYWDKWAPEQQEEYREKRQNTYSIATIYWISAISVGGGIILCSVPMLSIGYHRRNHAYEMYNFEQKKKQPQLSLGMQASENGIGLALQF